MEKEQGQEVDLWLPSELNYDDFFAEGKKWKDDGAAAGFGFAFPSEIPFLFSSNPDSPVDSVTETETESEDEDYLAGLTQRMAHSFLHDDDDDNNSDFSSEAKDTAVASDNTKYSQAAAMAVSPQSTLCSGLSVPKKLPSSGDGLTPVMTSSQPLSPPAKQNEKVVPLSPQDLQQLQQIMDLQVMHHQQIKKPIPAVSVPYKKAAGSFFSPSINHSHLRAAQFPLVKQQQLPAPAVWAGQSKARSVGVENYRALGLPSAAWPPLHRQPLSPSPRRGQQPQQQQQRHIVGSGMRAVFLNSPGTKKESAGTGVFLPRIAGSKPEPPRRKQACSPVLVPARVVQALNLNMEQLGAQPRFTNAGAYAEYILNHDIVLSRSNSFAAYQKQRGHLRPQPVVTSGDVHLLPHEWTY